MLIREVPLHASRSRVPWGFPWFPLLLAFTEVPLLLETFHARRLSRWAALLKTNVMYEMQTQQPFFLELHLAATCCACWTIEISDHKRLLTSETTLPCNFLSMGNGHNFWSEQVSHQDAHFEHSPFACVRKCDRTLLRLPAPWDCVWWNARYVYHVYMHMYICTDIRICVYVNMY